MSLGLIMSYLFQVVLLVAPSGKLLILFLSCFYCVQRIQILWSTLVFCLIEIDRVKNIPVNYVIVISLIVTLNDSLVAS